MPNLGPTLAANTESHILAFSPAEASGPPLSYGVNGSFSRLHPGPKSGMLN